MSQFAQVKTLRKILQHSEIRSISDWGAKRSIHRHHRENFKNGYRPTR